MFLTKQNPQPKQTQTKQQENKKTQTIKQNKKILNPFTIMLLKYKQKGR